MPALHTYYNLIYTDAPQDNIGIEREILLGRSITDRFNILKSSLYNDNDIKIDPYDILMVTPSNFKNNKHKILDIIKNFHPDTNPEIYVFNSFCDMTEEYRMYLFKVYMGAYNEVKKKI